MSTSRIFLIAISLFLLKATGAWTQHSIGLRGGFNLSSVNNFPLEGVEGASTEGVIFGNYNAISFEIGLSERFALQPETTYLQKGGKIGLADNGDFSFTVKLNYLEIPLLAKWRLGSGPFKGYLIAGPSFGYALTGETSLKADLLRIKDDVDFDGSFGPDGRKDNRFDFGFVGGGGIQYKAGPGSIVLDARAALDMNDFTLFNDGTPDGHKATRWESVSVSLGYQYEFGGR